MGKPGGGGGGGRFGGAGAGGGGAEGLLAGRLVGASSLLMVNFIISKSCIANMNVYVCSFTCKAVILFMLCNDAILEPVEHVAKCAYLATDLALEHRDAVFTVNILCNAILFCCVSSHVVLDCMYCCMTMLIAASLH